jgi:hypothetical protein
MDGMNEKSAKISGSPPLPSTVFSLLYSNIRRFITRKNEEREKWRLIIQEAKAHPEMQHREEVRTARQMIMQQASNLLK